MYRKIYIMLAISIMLSVSGGFFASAGTTDGQVLHPTPSSMDFYGYIDGALAGDELAVYDESGVLCGLSTLSIPGQYGFVHVYGDDSTTTVDEGADLDVPLKFYLNGTPLVPLSSREMLWLGDGQRLRVDFRRN
ncbi:MAG: hypothetical protein ACYDH8_12015 [Syntrophales bacterium]